MTERKETVMKEQITEIASEEQAVGAVAQPGLPSATLGGAVLVGAIYDPKLPPLVGD